MIAAPITTIERIGPSWGQFIISAPNTVPRYPKIIAIMEEIAAAELENWLPVCKSKPLFLKVLARLNSGISRNHDFSGIYVSKLELTKPNRLNQLLRRDKITPDQFLFWKKTHFKRRSNSSFFFCKIKFHPWWQCLWIRMAVRSVYFFSRYGVRLISLAGITLMPSLAKVSSP